MILAIDLGDRHVGLALGHPPDTPSHRYGTLDAKLQDVLAEVMKVIEKERVTTVIVGVPMSFSGEETEQTYKSLRFIESLRGKVHPGVEVEGVDETLTSSEARRVIETEGGNMNDEHAEAARLMLVSYLQQNS